MWCFSQRFTVTSRLGPFSVTLWPLLALLGQHQPAVIPLSGHCRLHQCPTSAHTAHPGGDPPLRSVTFTLRCLRSDITSEPTCGLRAVSAWRSRPASPEQRDRYAPGVGDLWDLGERDAGSRKEQRSTWIIVLQLTVHLVKTELGFLLSYVNICHVSTSYSVKMSSLV